MDLIVIIFGTSVYNDCQIFIWMESFSLAQEQRKTTPLFFK